MKDLNVSFFTIQVLKHLSLMSVLLYYMKSTLLFQASTRFNLLWKSYNLHVSKLTLELSACNQYFISTSMRYGS